MSEMMAPKNAVARRRGKPIEVWVTDEEKAAITELADQTGLSRSAYLRAVGLNRPVGARADLEAVRELVKLNGDLGRVAGLLKLWLAEKRGQGAKPIDVERVMIEFRELQAQIREKMSAIVFARK
ncbi:CopG family transcriptional regulator [Salmonella enterica subsp. diarizonae]|nr:CopG family transcriptional regulator [Salmonella enterica subsp. diarizonae]